jgi:riboflavin synthase
MFTGIITDVGQVRRVEDRGDLHARIATGYDTAASTSGRRLPATACA